MKRLNNIQDLDVLRQQILEQRQSIRKRIRICGGPGCHSGGGERLIGAFQKLLDEKGAANEYMVTQTGCHGFCARGPIVVIEPANIFYERVKMDHVAEIFERSVMGDELVE